LIADQPIRIGNETRLSSLIKKPSRISLFSFAVLQTMNKKPLPSARNVGPCVRGLVPRCIGPPQENQIAAGLGHTGESPERSLNTGVLVHVFLLHLAEELLTHYVRIEHSAAPAILVHLRPRFDGGGKGEGRIEIGGQRILAGSVGS
jgi:hypothetical protein